MMTSQTIETTVVVVDAQHPNAQSLAIASQIIRDDGLVAFPTETVYGLGANALSTDAVARIFAAKGRPAGHPLIVHIGDIDQLDQVARAIPDAAHNLMNRFWPGPLTLILARTGAVPDAVTGGRDTVAVRFPSHPVALGLIRAAGVPIAAPSANRFSHPSPTSAQHVLDDLAGRVELVLDGGHTDIGLESTIIDLSGDVPTVLRPGGLSLEALRDALPTLAYTPRRSHQPGMTPAPGTLVKHYSPNATVCVYEGDSADVIRAMQQEIRTQHEQNRSVGVLAPDQEADQFAALAATVIRLGDTLEEYAQRLYESLRTLDSAGVDTILVASPEQTSLGVAIADRLFRAAEGRVIRVSPTESHPED